MRVWKLLGVAGLAGVAATGAIVARDHRRRAQLGPDQVRERLHRRVQELQAADPGGRSGGSGSAGSTDSSARA